MHQDRGLSLESSTLVETCSFLFRQVSPEVQIRCVGMVMVIEHGYGKSCYKIVRGVEMF